MSQHTHTTTDEGDHPARPTASAPNERLRELTRSRGWTQDELARRLVDAARAAGIRGAAFDPKTIRRWMRGESTWPWPDHRRCLEAVFALPAIDLGFVPPWNRGHAPAPGTGKQPSIPWTHPGTVSFLVTATRSDPMHIDRRNFVTMAGAAALTPASAWLRKDPDTSTTGAGPGARVDDTQVTRVQRRIDDLRLMDDDLGGGDLITLITADLAYVTDKLRHGRYTDVVGRRLHAAAAELARLAGWVSFDDDRHSQALVYWEAALRAAHTSGDRALGAHILANMANQAYHTASPQSAVALVETAQAGAKNTATPRVRSLLAARLARAHSKNHDPHACRASLDRARVDHARGTHDDDPAWTYYVTTAEIALTTGSCHLELGDHAAAVTEFTTALDDYGDTCHRDRSLVWGRLATAHLARHDLDRALDAGTHALELVDGTVHSTRSTGHIRDFAVSLADHTAHNGVRDFLDRAHPVLAPA